MLPSSKGRDCDVSSFSKGKDDGPMREETRQRKRAFDFLKVIIIISY